MTGAIECRYYGRDFTEDEMALLRALIAAVPQPTRAALSREFCRRIGWLKPDGGLKDMMARVTMLAMHRDGVIALPPPRGLVVLPVPIVDMGEPTLAQLFEAGPAVVVHQVDVEHLADLAVEVRRPRGGAGDGGDPEPIGAAETIGEQAEGDALSGAGLAGDQGEAALAHEMLFDPDAEAVDGGAGHEAVDRQIGGERVPLQAVQREQFAVHDVSPRSSSSPRSGLSPWGSQAGGRPVAAWASSMPLSGGGSSPPAAALPPSSLPPGAVGRRPPEALPRLSRG